MLLMQARAKESQRQLPGLGVMNGKLRPCGIKPNCVNSEYPDDDRHFVDSIGLNNDMTIDLLKQSIIDSGGVIIQAQDLYLHAVYSSRLFGFVDDLELRLDKVLSRIHLRSASRVGKYDMGANRKRVKSLIKALKTK